MVAPAPGIYPDIKMQDYHEWNAASNSRLSRLMQSAAHMKAYIEAEHEDTPALKLGRAIHTAVLEPDLFPDQYTVASQCVAVTNKGTRCTNGGTWPIKGDGFVCGVHAKTAAANDLEIDQSREVLSESDHAVCMGVRDSVRSLHSAGGLLESVQETELSVVWVDPESGVTCKARWDGCARLVAGGTIIDLKSSRDASRYAFERQVYNLGYYRQGSLYLQSARAVEIPARHYAMLAVEKEPPFAAAVYRLNEGAISAGDEELKPLLARYAECLETGEYPAYPDRVIDIALPHYAWAQVDERLDDMEAVA